MTNLPNASIRDRWCQLRVSTLQLFVSNSRQAVMACSFNCPHGRRSRSSGSTSWTSTSRVRWVYKPNCKPKNRVCFVLKGHNYYMQASDEDYDNWVSAVHPKCLFQRVVKQWLHVVPTVLTDDGLEVWAARLERAPVEWNHTSSNGRRYPCAKDGVSGRRWTIPRLRQGAWQCLYFSQYINKVTLKIYLFVVFKTTFVWL